MKSKCKKCDGSGVIYEEKFSKKKGTKVDLSVFYPCNCKRK